MFLIFVNERMIKSKKRPVHVSGKSAIDYFLVRTTYAMLLLKSAISASESVQDVANDHETPNHQPSDSSIKPVGWTVAGSMIFHG